MMINELICVKKFHVEDCLYDLVSMIFFPHMLQIPFLYAHAWPG